ncbi:MAG: hypothetical protein H8D78_00050 [Chloroflexi bacterium]|nr:hypothetical protein [Chloroflexota bacterium]
MAISVRPGDGVYWGVEDDAACLSLFSALTSGADTLVDLWCGELGISPAVARQACLRVRTGRLTSKAGDGAGKA